MSWTVVLVLASALATSQCQGMRMLIPEGGYSVDSEYVCDNRILKYDGMTGELIGIFTSADSFWPLDGPQNLILGPEGYVYVANSGSDDVQRYDAITGDFVDVFASGGGLDDCGDLTFGPDGNLYVTGFHSRNVLRYNGTTGAFLDEFISLGSGGLYEPTAIAFGPDNNAYVASTSSEILRYDGTTGNFIDEFVPKGYGGLTHPGAMIFGPDGHIYICSMYAGEVLRYDGATGAFLGIFIPAVSLHGDDLFPTELIFGPGGDLYVCYYRHATSMNWGHILRYDGTTGAFINQFASGMHHPTGILFIPEPGDANMDNKVTVADFLALQNNFHQAGGWTEGDFNYDGMVTIADFLILQANFGYGTDGGTTEGTEKLTRFAAAIELAGEKGSPSETIRQEHETDTNDQKAAPLDALCPVATIILFALVSVGFLALTKPPWRVKR